MRGPVNSRQRHRRPTRPAIAARARRPVADDPQPVATSQVVVIAHADRRVAEPVGHTPSIDGSTPADDQAPVSPLPPAPHRGLYLLHIEPRYRHAAHYLGWADDIPRRVHEHASCGARSSPLIRAALAAGCRITLARVWLGGDRHQERRLKRAGGLGHLCPTCQARGYVRRGRTPGWRRQV
jgi:hypothetical protein